MKRTIAGLLLIAMLLCCAAAGAEERNLDPYAPYAETVYLSKGTTILLSGQLPEGDSYEYNEFTRYLEKTQNIKVTTAWEVDSANFNQKVSLSIAIREIPDFMVVDRKVYRQLLENDLLADLTDVYDKTISPFLREQFDSYGERLFNEVTVDGRLMGIPGTSLGHCQNVLWIRKDWLDRVGMNVPKTVEDIENVARAFIALDPNGNGDTIGLTTGPSVYGGYNSWGYFDSVFAALGAYPGVWMEKEGQAVYGSVLPEVKDALTLMARWYREGILDKEFAIRTAGEREALIASNRLGMYFSVWWPANGLAAAAELCPEAEWIAVSAPVNAEGKLTYAQNDPIQKVLVVSKECEHPEAVIKALNAGYDVLRCNDGETNPYAEQARQSYEYFMATSPQGWGFMATPIEINYEDCIRVQMEDIENAIRANDPSVMRIKGFEHSYELVKQNRLSPKTNFSAYIEELARIVGTGAAISDNVEAVPTCFYDTTRTMSTMWSSLQKMENQAMLKVIMGDAEPDSYDDFIKKWYNAGGKRITNEVEAARKK